MTLLAQHGSKKSDKISEAINNNLISGVILSPRGEKPANLEAYVRALAAPSNQLLMIDTQFHLATLTPLSPSNLVEYPFFRLGLTRADFVSPRNMRNFVESALEYQAALPVNYLIGPTVLFQSFDDPWSQIALQMAQLSAEVKSAQKYQAPLLVSLVFAETALGQTTQLDQFLDMASMLEDVDGFYIVIRRNTADYRAQMEPHLLENLMYLVYSLAEMNGFSVVLGYTDFVGLNLQPFNIVGCGSGWFGTTRQFMPRSYEPSTGGSPANKRYSSDKLLNSVLLFPEVETACVRQLGNQILTGNQWDAHFATSREPWTALSSALQHWDSLNRCNQKIRAGASLSDRFDNLSSMIADAVVFYQNLERVGLVFHTSSNKVHLDHWARAITSFRARVQI